MKKTPTFQELIIPILNLLKSGKKIQIKDFEHPLSKTLELSEEQVKREFESL